MDYRNIGENGEPPIVHVDNEGGPDDVVIKHVADNLVEFIEMILEGQDIDGE